MTDALANGYALQILRGTNGEKPLFRVRFIKNGKAAAELTFDEVELDEFALDLVSLAHRRRPSVQN